MIKIGAITEGVTDHQIIEDILIGFFDDEDAFEYKQLQPVTDATDDSLENRQGGWGHVIKYCESHDKLKNNLIDLDFLLIQLDADIMHELKLDRTGSESPEELFDKISAHLKLTIGNEIIDQFEDKLLFAIGIDSIECWLLAFHEKQPAKQKKTTGCLETLNRAIRTTHNFYIDANNKDISHYRKLSEPFIKRKNLEKVYDKNPGLKIFYDQLKSKLVA